MRNFFARRMIQRMGARYDCDVSYLLYLLAEAPKAFWMFMRASVDRFIASPSFRSCSPASRSVSPSGVVRML